jgi:hypothetical protein
MASDFTEETAADAVTESFGPQTDPQLCEILTALVTHLHGFAREVELTIPEWKPAPPSRITWEQAVVKSLQTARESGHAVWAPRAEAALNDIARSRTQRQPLWTWG